MGFTSDACWFLLIKTLLIKNYKKREAVLKTEAGGDKKHVFFLLGLIHFQGSEFSRSPFGCHENSDPGKQIKKKDLSSSQSYYLKCYMVRQCS